MDGRKKKPFPESIAFLVLFSDCVAAAAVWYFREALLGPGQDMIAAVVSACLILFGLVGYHIFKKLDKDVL